MKKFLFLEGGTLDSLVEFDEVVRASAVLWADALTEKEKMVLEFVSWPSKYKRMAIDSFETTCVGNALLQECVDNVEVAWERWWSVWPKAFTQRWSYRFLQYGGAF
ncbi:MAG: hypothetical protein Q7R92_00970 [bacterium]|nr:hypothetical protein [bacterium]